jgi:hypothetical protein
MQRYRAWLFRRAKSRIVDGIPVGIDLTEATQFQAILGKLESALELLGRHDPRALAVLRREAAGIFVFATAGAHAEWWRDVGLVVMQHEYVSDPATSPPEIAATLVHEATHAWLEHLGFQYTVERRARIESICIRRALRFARRLPCGSDLVARLAQQLPVDPHSLTDEAFQRRVRAELERLGVPNWLLQIMGAVREMFIRSKTNIHRTALSRGLSLGRRASENWQKGAKLGKRKSSP